MSEQRGTKACSSWQGKGPLQKICRIREDKGVCRVGAGTFFLCPSCRKTFLFHVFRNPKLIFVSRLFCSTDNRNRGIQTQTEECDESAQTERQRSHHDRQPLAPRGAPVGHLYALHRRVPWKLRPVQCHFSWQGTAVSRPLWGNHLRGGQGLPDRLLSPQHHGVCPWSRGNAGGSGSCHLPDGQYRDRIRRREQGEDEGPDLYRCIGKHRYRPEELGALRARSRHFRDQHGLRGECLRDRPGTPTGQQREDRRGPEHALPRRAVQALPRGLRRHPGADERGGHEIRRCRVCDRKAGR